MQRTIEITLIRSYPDDQLCTPDCLDGPNGGKNVR